MVSTYEDWTRNNKQGLKVLILTAASTKMSLLYVWAITTLQDYCMSGTAIQ